MAINTTTYDRTPGTRSPGDVPNRGLYYGIGVAVLLLLIIVFAVRTNRISPATTTVNETSTTNVERSQMADPARTAPPMESTTAPVNQGTAPTDSGTVNQGNSTTTNPDGTTRTQEGTGTIPPLPPGQ